MSQLLDVQATSSQLIALLSLNASSMLDALSLLLISFTLAVLTLSKRLAGAYPTSQQGPKLTLRESLKAKPLTEFYTSSRAITMITEMRLFGS
jgi:hypothetical protein